MLTRSDRRHMQRRVTNEIHWLRRDALARAIGHDRPIAPYLKLSTRQSPLLKGSRRAMLVYATYASARTDADPVFVPKEKTASIPIKASQPRPVAAAPSKRRLHPPGAQYRSQEHLSALRLVQYDDRVQRATKLKREARKEELPLLGYKSPFDSDFFRFADGVYSSYWLGRLVNMFIRQGKKKTIIKQMHEAMLLLKLRYQLIPLLLLHEVLETLKPVFLLRYYKVRRPKLELVAYPYVAKNSRRYLRALQWVRRELEAEGGRWGSDTSFSARVYNKLVIFREHSRNIKEPHSLVALRNEHNSVSNLSQANIRYNWKRNRQW